MGMGHIEVEFLLHEHRFRPITGEVLAIGRQHIGPKGYEVLEMLERYEIPVRSKVFDIDKTNLHSKPDENSITDVSLFKSFSEATFLAADISPYEGAEIIFDICGEVPADLVGRFDFIIDGGSLDNIFDPVRMISNMAKMLKPGGRMFVFAWSNGFPSAYVKITPDWLMDYFAVNEFEDAKVYSTRNDMPGGEPRLGESVEVFHYDPFVKLDGDTYEAAFVKVAGYSSTYCIAETGRKSTHDRTAVQKHYRGPNIEPYLTSARRFHNSPRPIFARPGDSAPSFPPISDMITVRPVARFGVPANLQNDEILMRRLDLLTAELEKLKSTLPTQIYHSQQLLSKQLYDSRQELLNAAHQTLQRLPQTKPLVTHHALSSSSQNPQEQFLATSAAAPIQHESFARDVQKSLGSLVEQVERVRVELSTQIYQDKLERSLRSRLRRLVRAIISPGSNRFKS